MLIACNCEEAFLQGAKICSLKFKLLSIVTPNNLTDFVALIVLFSIFKVLLVFLI